MACATLPAPARKLSNTRTAPVLVSPNYLFSAAHPISHLPAEVEIHTDKSSFELSFYPECINLSFHLDNWPFRCVCLVFLWALLWHFFPPLSCFCAAVHQPQAPVCLSPWQWRRIIVVAVTSWPSVDTSWTGTSSRFTLSTLPAMMLWVIWQAANEHSEVLWPCFLSNTKTGWCEWGTAGRLYPSIHPSFSVLMLAVSAAFSVHKSPSFFYCDNF